MPPETAPTPTPPPVAPAAPAVTTPPPPAAKPDPKADRHPGVNKLMGSLFKQAGEPEKKKEEPAPEKPAETPPPAPAAAPKGEEKPIKVKKPKRPELPIPARTTAATPPPPAPAAPAPTAPAQEEELEEHEKQALEDAREAEKLFPQKYPGLAAKTEKYIRGHLALLKKMRELHGEDFDGEDPEYKKWIAANKPPLTTRDMEEIRTARIRNEVSRESDKKLEDVKHEIYARSEEPKIKQEGLTIYKKLAAESLPVEVVEMVRTKGFEEANKYYKVELQVADNILQAAAEDAEEFIRLTTENPVTKRRVVAFDPNNEQHQRLSEMVAHVCENFKNSNSPSLRKDGKWFVTRDEWNQMDPTARNQYWTFTDKQILEEATKAIPAVVKAAIEHRHKEREAEGYIRAPRPQPQATPPAPVASSAPPAPRPTPVPPGNQTNGSAHDPRVRSLAANLGNRR